MPDPSTTYALILAGGSGTRFWPLSRNAKPKQLLNLFGDTTLLAQTIARLEGLVPVENILILTNAQQEAGVREIASMLPAENIFAEPAKRDTAPAVALGIGLVAARNPDALMMVLPADQLIQDTAAFHAVMRDALAIAEKSDGLVTIGIKPTWPCPSYGYIERLPVHHVKIDGSFVRDVIDNPLHRAIVESVYIIGRTLKIKTVAEAVETRDIADALAAIGIDYGQGWLFSRPRPLNQVFADLGA